MPQGRSNTLQVARCGPGIRQQPGNGQFLFKCASISEPRMFKLKSRDHGDYCSDTTIMQFDRPRFGEERLFWNRFAGLITPRVGFGAPWTQFGLTAGVVISRGALSESRKLFQGSKRIGGSLNAFICDSSWGELSTLLDMDAYQTSVQIG